MERKYRYLGYVLLLLIPLILAGFYKTYFEEFPGFPEWINRFDHLHAIAASLWVLLLIVQPILIAGKYFRAHRWVGRFSYLVVPLFLLSVLPQAMKGVERGDFKGLFFPIGDSALLLSFYLLAIVYRKKTAWHMRYMIAAALPLLGPTIGRIGPIFFKWGGNFTQGFQYGIMFSILLGLFYYDGWDVKKSRPYLIGMAFLSVHAAAFFLIFG